MVSAEKRTRFVKSFSFNLMPQKFSQTLNKFSQNLNKSSQTSRNSLKTYKISFKWEMYVCIGQDKINLNTISGKAVLSFLVHSDQGPVHKQSHVNYNELELQFKSISSNFIGWICLQADSYLDWFCLWTGPRSWPVFPTTNRVHHL